MEHQPAQPERQNAEHQDGERRHPANHPDQKGVDQKGEKPAGEDAARQKRVNVTLGKVLLQELAHGGYVTALRGLMQDK